MAVVTNIDREHLDTYRDLADIQEAFLGFVNKVPFYGAAVLCLDDAAGAGHPAPRRAARASPTALSPQAHVSARDLDVGPLGSTYTATVGGEPLGPSRSRCPAPTTSSNSLAAVAVGLDLGVAFDAIQAGLESFTGVDRRFQVRGEAGGVLVVDDYGHHPTEIRATLEALRTPRGRAADAWSSSSPTATRAPQALWDDFCRAFHQADVLLLTDIYAAGEEPIAGDHRRGPGPGDRRARAPPRRLRGRPQGGDRAARGRGAARATWC